LLVAAALLGVAIMSRQGLTVAQRTREAVATGRPPVEPVLDGEVTNYFEWVGAGCVETAAATGAMHQISAPASAVSLIEFGFNLDALFVRVDTVPLARDVLDSGFNVIVNFLEPPGLRVDVRGAAGRVVPLHG